MSGRQDVGGSGHGSIIGDGGDSFRRLAHVFANVSGRGAVVFSVGGHLALMLPALVLRALHKT